jgi:hypothetical protein
LVKKVVETTEDDKEAATVYRGDLIKTIDTVASVASFIYEQINPQRNH